MGQVRLQGGFYPSKGRVEVFSDENWRIICRSSFGEQNADLVCRQMGYTQAEYYNSLSS